MILVWRQAEEGRAWLVIIWEFREVVAYVFIRYSS
jgi:hypothetical protein